MDILASKRLMLEMKMMKIEEDIDRRCDRDRNRTDLRYTILYFANLVRRLFPPSRTSLS